MNADETSDLGRQGRNDFQRTVVVVVSCILSVVVLYYAGGKALLNSQSVKHPTTVDPNSRETSDSESGSADSKSAEAVAKSSVNIARLVEAHELGEQVTSEVAQAQSDIEKWAEKTTVLPKGDSGRRIAKFPDFVDQYAAIVEQPTVSSSDHDRWVAQLGAILPRINEAHSEENGSVVVTPEEILLLRNLLAEVQSARQVLTKNVRSLDSLVVSASDTDPGDDTLEVALAKRIADRDGRYLKDLAAAKRKAGDEINAEYVDRIVAEHRTQQELLNKQRLNAEQLATEEQRIELDRIAASVAAIQSRRAKAMLIQEFNRERALIDSLLAPFIDNAITQPSRNSPISKGGPMRPTSLGSLKASGALDDTRKGLDFLYHVGGHPANMRNKGGFPSFVQLTPIPDDSVRAKVKQAQQLLLKYGDVMVEEGLLSQ